MATRDLERILEEYGRALKRMAEAFGQIAASLRRALRRVVRALGRKSASRAGANAAYRGVAAQAALYAAFVRSERPPSLSNHTRGVFQIAPVSSSYHANANALANLDAALRAMRHAWTGTSITGGWFKGRMDFPAGVVAAHGRWTGYG